MIIDSEFMNAYSITGYSVDKRFESKKNQVYLIRTLIAGNREKYFVLKKYNNPSRMQTEIEFLRRLKGKVSVPGLYYCGSDYIITEYLDGEILLDTLYGQCGEEHLPLADPGSLRQLIHELSRWLKGFYAAAKSSSGLQIILGDVNFRNFIFNGRIYGIDFEDCCEGYMEKDAGKICAFSLTYIPAFTDRKIIVARELLKTLIKELGLNREFVIEEARKELQSIGQRRKLNIPAEILNKVCE